MKGLNNLKIQYKCSGCEFRAESFFCHLSPPALQVFESVKITSAYAKGATIFVEGQPAHGVYVICQGRVKLSTCSPDGKVIILRVAEAGEVLGLSAVISDAPHQTTAEVLEACQVNFVGKRDFMRLLEQYAEAGLSTARQLSRRYHTAYAQICSLGLSNSVADRLTKLLLGWSKSAGVNTDRGSSGGSGSGSGSGGESDTVRLKITYTHEEIAEMIGTTRETVTRLFKKLRERELITLKGSELIIHDRKKLECASALRSDDGGERRNM